MNSSDIRIAIADQLVDGDSVELSHLFSSVAEEANMEWTTVRSIYRSMKSNGLVTSSGSSRGGWRAEATDKLGPWLDQATSPQPAVDVRPVLVSRDRPVPRPVWKSLMEAFNRGEYVMAFIPADSTVVAHKDAKGKTRRVEPWNQ